MERKDMIMMKDGKMMMPDGTVRMLADGESMTMGGNMAEGMLDKRDKKQDKAENM